MSGKRLALLSLFVGLLAVAGRIEADPILDRVAAESKIAADKVEARANFALAEAKVFISARQYAKAQDVLEEAMAKVKNSPDLSESRRTNIQQRLRTRLREVEQNLQTQRAAADEAIRKEEDRERREREAQKASGGNGKGSTVIAKDRITQVKDQLAAIDRLRGKQAAARIGVLNSLEASATPIAGVVEYPAYWRELTESRKKFSGPQLSKKEAEILRALNSTMTPNFDKVPFKQVIEYLSEKTDQAIIVDENSLKDAMVEYDDPVDFTLKVKVTVRTILKKILAEKGLAYIIRDGTIQVMTAQKAREITVIRAYPVSDLVGGTFQPFDPLTNQVVSANVQSLIQTIQNAVEPGYWKENGGPGTITFHPQSGTLIIRASAELHYMFGAGGLFK